MNQQSKEALNDLSYQVIGAAIEVHRILGPGLLESLYENALCIELEERSIPYEQQKAIDVLYKNRSIGSKRLDILVDNRIILELKAVESLDAVHMAQTLTYLKITGCKLGLLINFNVRVLKQGIKRIIL